MFCKYCGKEIYDGAVSCGHCGKNNEKQKLKAAEEPVENFQLDAQFADTVVTPEINIPYVQTKKERKPKKKKKKLFAILILIAFLFSSGFGSGVWIAKKGWDFNSWFQTQSEDESLSDSEETDAPQRDEETERDDDEKSKGESGNEDNNTSSDQPLESSEEPNLDNQQSEIVNADNQ